MKAGGMFSDQCHKVGRNIQRTGDPLRRKKDSVQRDPRPGSDLFQPETEGFQGRKGAGLGSGTKGQFCFNDQSPQNDCPENLLPENNGIRVVKRQSASHVIREGPIFRIATYVFKIGVRKPLHCTAASQECLICFSIKMAGSGGLLSISKFSF